MPEDRDICQAAALLIGVYGDHAADYAAARKEELDGESEPVEVETWAQIAVKLKEISYSLIAEGSPH